MKPHRYALKFLLACVLSITLPLLASGQVGKNAHQEKPSSDWTKSPVAYRKKHPIKGIIFHCCSCSVPCPCMFNAKDVEGCDITRIFHITDGGYMGDSIKGQTAVLVPHPKEMADKKLTKTKEGKAVDAILYLPKGLSKSYQDDLSLAIYENYVPIGMMATVTRYAPISFQKAQGGYDVSIPGVLQVKTRPALGASRQPIVADNLDLDGGKRWFIGRSKVQTYQDPEEKEWQWSIPDKNGSWSLFTWEYYDRP